MEIIDINNGHYPDNLKDITDPPKKLYVLGDVSILSSKSIAIIGSRKCTEYGKNQGIKFAYELAKEGFTIISGMAKRNRYFCTYWCTKGKRKDNCCFRYRF